jgi:hypothetical protein
MYHRQDVCDNLILVKSVADIQNTDSLSINTCQPQRLQQHFKQQNGNKQQYSITDHGIGFVDIGFGIFNSDVTWFF